MLVEKFNKAFKAELFLQYLPMLVFLHLNFLESFAFIL